MVRIRWVRSAVRFAPRRDTIPAPNDEQPLLPAGYLDIHPFPQRQHERSR